MAQIIPIKELKNTTKISELCHERQEPVYVTKNGYGDMVLMSIEVFEEMSHKLELYRELAISEKQFKEGKMEDAYASLKKLREKHGI
ncbi:MAG: type II toxin-antitoxin system Phd/YefM family antitoxin [Firmicutes bacterium]|nr:type II toxin-antitoxin system Phd/YefM family antitoxin [Bacillota bacterium]